MVKEQVFDRFTIIPTLKFKHHTSIVVLVADEFYLITIVIIITWTKSLRGDLPSGCIFSGVSETVVKPRSSSLILFYVRERENRNREKQKENVKSDTSW